MCKHLIFNYIQCVESPSSNHQRAHYKHKKGDLVAEIKLTKNNSINQTFLFILRYNSLAFFLASSVISSLKIVLLKESRTICHSFTLNRILFLSELSISNFFVVCNKTLFAPNHYIDSMTITLNRKN